MTDSIERRPDGLPPVTGEGDGKEFTRRMMAVELANEVAEFLGLNPCDEIPFRELTERLHDWRVRQRPTPEPSEAMVEAGAAALAYQMTAVNWFDIWKAEVRDSFRHRASVVLRAALAAQEGK